MSLALQKEKLETLLARCRKLVFFGGAGVSTESGIPDFRSATGLTRQTGQTAWPWPVETMLSRSFFFTHTTAFYAFYRAMMVHTKARPNPAHMRLADLEAKGLPVTVITQNIDGLHQLAGSRQVLELHGSIHRNRCLGCDRRHGLEAITQTRGVPRCACGGLIKPEVVLYQEALDQGVLSAAIEALRQADLLLVGGTSLAVYPAAGLIDAYQGKDLVIINRDPTNRDSQASLVIRGPIGTILAPV